MGELKHNGWGWFLTRGPTLLAMGMVGSGWVALAVMWVWAWHQGWTEGLWDPGHYAGNKGPWGRNDDILLLSGHSLEMSIQGFLVAVAASVLDKRPVLGVATMIAAIGLLVVNFLHTPLVD